ncbi:MAG: RHS repeat-associated core domain-containing protein, partial [Clostridium sp.]|nr:RHS repeat-associated core domain-containing protein [Clostridium sp.]
MRTEKIVNGVTTKYHLAGDRVTFEDNGTDKIYYTYDDDSNLVSMNLNGTEYYYVRNAQGDIIGLYDKNGTQVVSYTYDSWGKIISIDGSLKDSVGIKNPYRYRGYRYDNETGLYYLQSRYYNPEWGRFINAD